MKLPDRARARLTPGFSIFCSLAAMTVAIGAIGFIFAGVADSDQLQIEQQIVRSANKDALAKLGDALRNNAYWDIAYDQLIDTPDPKWTEQNLGPYAHDTTGTSALFVFGERDRVIYRYVAPDQKIAPGEFEADPALITLVHEAGARPGAPPNTAVGFVGVRGKIYLGAASLIVPNDDRAKGVLQRHNVEVYLTEFDASKISKVQTDFRLSRVSIVNAPPPKPYAQIPLDDAAGAKVAYLAWLPATPGTDLAYSVGPYALLAIAIVGLLQWVGLMNWVATVRLLEQAKNEAGKLREESWSKTMFLANMSHELRTPLNAIIGYSEMMSREIFGPIPDRYRSYTKNIHESGHHLLHIVNDVLDLTKLQNSGDGVDLEPVSLVSVLHETQSVLQDFASVKSVELDFDIASCDVMVMSNAKALNKIVLNLGTNGIKFGDAGKTVRVSASYDSASQSVWLVVGDQGCGIPQEKLPFLGQPFYQAESSYSRKPGAGLGLAMVKTLITRLGGTLAIESEVGVGTTVKVRLPAPRFVPEVQWQQQSAA
jgi:signal transduction histidine kinase